MQSDGLYRDKKCSKSHATHEDGRFSVAAAISVSDSYGPSELVKYLQQLIGSSMGKLGDCGLDRLACMGCMLIEQSYHLLVSMFVWSHVHPNISASAPQRLGLALPFFIANDHEFRTIEERETQMRNQPIH